MLRPLLRFIERGRKGYCQEDLWGFDYWLSELIANGLKAFKKNCHGYPSDGISWEEWMKTLDEMIECFEEQRRTYDNILDPSKSKEHRRARKEKLHRGLELLERYWWDLWD